MPAVPRRSGRSGGDRGGIDQVVRRQLDIGIDCIGDGEFWKVRDFIYYSRHLTGLETRPLRPGETGSTRTFTRERDEFAQFYKDFDKAGTIFYVPGEKPMGPERERTVATGPISRRAPRALAQEIAAFKARSPRAGGRGRDVLLRLAPGWLDHFIYNEYYKTDEEYVFALAEAMREEYCAIVDAGFILQIDDPGCRLVGHAQAGAERRGVSRQVRAAAHRGAQPRAQGHSRGPRALSPVLGQLARAAHPRSAVRAHRRADAARSRRSAIRSRPPTCATSTNGSCGRTSSCPTAR